MDQANERSKDGCDSAIKNLESDRTTKKHNGEHCRRNLSNGTIDGKSESEEVNSTVLNPSQPSDPTESRKDKDIPRVPNYLRNSKGIVETDSLTSEVLSDLFNDKICVLCIRNYASEPVCEKLDSFLREKGLEQYTHEIRKNGRADLLYYGVNRYGYPLNSSYNDPTGNNLGRYLSEALSTIRSLRQAAHPYLSPIDKFRVEMDEAWHKNVNVASFQGQKTFCGIGRIMPASLSELSEIQPHFDAVPTSYFPQIQKQFSANFYLNVPETGGELEIWDVPPISIDNIENFTIPENWRAILPESIKVKPGRGDMLMVNTRRPHAITSFGGSNPRTSVQTFIGLAKNSEVFLWV